MISRLVMKSHLNYDGIDAKRSINRALTGIIPTLLLNIRMAYVAH